MPRIARLPIAAGLAGLALALSAAPASAAPAGLDRSFGDGGTSVVYPQPGWPVGRAAVAVAPDGSVVTTFSTGGRLLVMRHTVRGDRDSSFGGGRLVLLNGPMGTDWSGAPVVLGTHSGDVLVLPDGGVVAGGGECTSSPVCFADTLLARFTQYGSLDPSFDGDGRRTAPVGETSDSDAVEAITVDGQGRLLALSNPVYELAMGRHASPVIHVQRFLADGSLDASFGDGGRAEHVIGVKLYTDGALAVDAQDRVLYGARLFGDGFDDFTYPSRIVRLAADGRIDPTWQGDRMPGFAPGVPVTAIVPQADGTTLALVGHELVRLRADGTLDPAFGDGDGRVELPAEFDARAAVAAPGGGLFVAGRVGGDLALLQLGRDGAPLRGRRALHTTDLPEGRTGTAEDLAVAPDGRVVLIGRAVDDGTVVLARYSLKRQRLRWP